MKITVAETAGFCFGVQRAVDQLFSLLETETRPVVTLGPVIHNPQITKRLEDRGVRVVDEVPQLPFDGVVALRSHGVPKQCYAQLAERGIDFLDLTCPFVERIHKLVQEGAGEGRRVIILGHADHPEVIGIRSFAKDNRVFSTLEELIAYTEEDPDFRHLPTLLVVQTTFDVSTWEKCRNFVERVYTNVQISDTICNTTENRQKEAAALAACSDVMLVIGGKNSSNTTRLYELCQRNCPKALLLESAEEIPREIFSQGMKVGITAGASTPADVIKEAASKMTDINETLNNPAVEAADENAELSFEQMLEDSLLTLNTGDRVKVTIVSIGATEVQVDLGTKHTAYIPISELSDDPTAKPEDIIQPGDEVEAFVVRVNDVEGTIMLSKKRVDAIKGWDEIEAAVDSGAIMEGQIVEVVKGGVIALCNGTRVFIPGSQAPGGRDADHTNLVGTTQQFKILEVNRKRRRVIGSIRAIAREARRAAEEKFWSEAEIGKHYNGVVKSLTSYGAFVDIGGVDGMIHLSELSWSKIRHPSEVVNVGDEIEVYIKDLDPERKRISLGYKNLLPNPWDQLKETYKEGDVAHVKIVKLMPFGAFAELIPGIDGLIYISQISTRRIDKPSSVLAVGDEVDVKIVSIDYEAMRVNLSIRALLEEKGIAAEVASDSLADETAPSEAPSAGEGEAAAVEAPAEEAAPETEAPVEEEADK